MDDVTFQWEQNPSTTVELIQKGAHFLSMDDALSFAGKSGFTLQHYRANTIEPMLTFNQAKPVRQGRGAQGVPSTRSSLSSHTRVLTTVMRSRRRRLAPWNPYVLKSLPIYKQGYLGKAKTMSSAGVDPATLRRSYAAAGYADLVAGHDSSIVPGPDHIRSLKIASSSAGYCRPWPTVVMHQLWRRAGTTAILA